MMADRELEEEEEEEEEEGDEDSYLLYFHYDTIYLKYFSLIFSMSAVFFKL